MSNPHEWHIANDHDGFFIQDEFGEEVPPQWLRGSIHEDWRAQSIKSAEAMLNEMVRRELDNYEPPDPLGFEAGFAENH